jgi:hypothetical protein
MATFGGLFDFPDLSDGQSELSSPPDSSDDTEDEEDPWYNLPSDSDDSDDDSAAPALPLLAPSSTAFIITPLGPKEYSTSARIKAIYMLEDKKSLAQIREATGVPKSAVYRLAAVARERGWVENKNMPLEVSHVLNVPRSGRPGISPEAIKCVLKVVL